MPQREYAIRNITISFGHFNNNYGSDDDTANDDDGVILLVGRSGSGKSTLLRLLSGIEYPNADGCIVVNGQTMASTSKKRGMVPGLPSWVKMGIVPRVQSPSGSDEERRGEIEAHAAIQPVILEGKPDFDNSQSVLERIVQVGEDAVSRFEKYAGWKQHRRSDATTTMLQILAEDITFLLMLTSKQKCRPSELSPSGEYLFGIACGCMMSMAPSIATSCHANCNSKVENENFVGVHYPILLLDELFDTEHPSIVESCSNGMLNLIRAGGIILSATHRPGHFRGISSRTITLSGGKVLGRIDEPY
jgi:energy-coupling factor transporter ATP-binding protein EcfA2